MRARTNILFAHWGDEGIRGSERVLLDLLAEIDRERFAPLLWCNAQSLADAARELDVSSRVSRMPILLGWDAPRFDANSFRALVNEGRALIREHEARVVHASSGAPNQWLVPAARSESVPLIAHLHAIYGFRERCTLLLHQAPVIVGCSGAVVAPFRADGIPESRLRVISNGVNFARVNMGEAGSLRRTLGIPATSLMLVGAGALVPLKGFHVLVRALQAVVERGIDAHLVIAGEGTEASALLALSTELGVRERVHLIGQQAHVGAVLRDAGDIAVIGSRIESFGLVAAEAGAVARPTVASRVGGIPEVIDDGATGLLVAAGDHVAYADAITRLARDPALLRAMGAAAHERTAARYTTARVARAFEGLYDELAHREAGAFGWRNLGFTARPFARLGLAVVGRRLGLAISDM